MGSPGAPNASPSSLWPWSSSQSYGMSSLITCTGSSSPMTVCRSAAYCRIDPFLRLDRPRIPFIDPFLLGDVGNRGSLNGPVPLAPNGELIETRGRSLRIFSVLKKWCRFYSSFKESVGMDARAGKIKGRADQGVMGGIL